GLNITGMKRRNFTREDIHALRSAYKHLFSDEGTFAERVKTLPAELAEFPSVRKVLKFVNEESKRGFCQPVEGGQPVSSWHHRRQRQPAARARGNAAGTGRKPLSPADRK